MIFEKIKKALKETILSLDCLFTSLGFGVLLYANSLSNEIDILKNSPIHNSFVVFVIFVLALYSITFISFYFFAFLNRHIKKHKTQKKD